MKALLEVLLLLLEQLYEFTRLIVLVVSLTQIFLADFRFVYLFVLSFFFISVRGERGRLTSCFAWGIPPSSVINGNLARVMEKEHHSAWTPDTLLQKFQTEERSNPATSMHFYYTQIYFDSTSKYFYWYGLQWCKIDSTNISWHLSQKYTFENSPIRKTLCLTLYFFPTF